MPSDAVTLAVTTGFGVSVVAGIVSGICYIVLHGFRRTNIKRNFDSVNPWQCNICGVHFRSVVDGVVETSKVVSCVRCKHRICRDRCSIKERLNEGWICHLCQRTTESWFRGILSVIQPNCGNGIHFKTKMNTGRIEEIDEDLERLRKTEKEQVRDFIERLVSTMLGGSVDDTCITKLYNDSHYDTLYLKYHAVLSKALTELGSALHISIANLPVTGQSPCTAHTSLKQLIQNIIRDALVLPELRKAEQLRETSSDDNPRTYEDLLATAVINKVIQTYQDERPGSSANASSRVSGSSKAPKDKEFCFGDETLQNKWKSSPGSVPDVDTTSISSLEDWIRSDSSLGSTKYVDHLSFTIKQHIEEVSPTEDSEDDGTESARIRTPLLIPSDDDNWFLQKRKFNGIHSPVPVPMLVPNPTTDAKVLIGDREAEDTSDLSDAASDYGDTESVPSINNILVESKTIIGGHNLLSFDSPDSDTADRQSSDDTSLSNEGGEMEENEVTLLDSAAGVDDSSSKNKVEEDSLFKSIDSNIEKDTEYTEKYSSLPRTILKIPIARPRTSEDNKLNEDEDSKMHLIINGVKDVTAQNHHKTEIFIQGRYSEREKEKWKHPVSMKYNPYSKENIEKRITSRSLGCSPTFGREYYVREASKPKGARKVNGHTEDDSVVEHNHQLSWPPSQENTLQDMSHQDLLVKAVPAKIEESTSETELSLSYQSNCVSLPGSIEDKMNTLEMSSDSDLSIERVYNPQSGKIIEKFGPTQKSAFVKHNIKRSIGNKVDENHNDVNIPSQENRCEMSKSVDSATCSSIKLPNAVTYETSNPSKISQKPHKDLVPLTIRKNAEITECNIRGPTATSIKEIAPIPAVRRLKLEQKPTENMENIEIPHEFAGSKESINCSQGFSEDEIIMDSISPDISLEPVPETQTPRIPSSYDTDSEILDLEGKHLVKHILREMSRSYPNLTKLPKTKSEPATQSTLTMQVDSQELRLLPSVQDLKKKFEESSKPVKHKDQKQEKQVYSLTARSIPREFRQELKHQGDILQKSLSASNISDKDSANYVLDNGIKHNLKEEMSDPVEVFPKAKLAIEYFEKLKSMEINK